ncbi:4-hydroxy-3-methylbut-2-enyl diphosphate reductase [Akkermansiaceae bacterium]|nr:4-hydroxy-3-methylbut-2-enyl diphosphate reductase [Akkermansiaceae bacterium]
MSDSPAPTKRKRVNVRRPDVMTLVQAEVEKHYYSPIVGKLRDRGGSFTIGKTTIRLAEQFGFCYGVERAIDLAYAARRVFPDQRIFLIGEIIHNQEVNQKLTEMNIVSLPWKEITEEYDQLESEDVVIVPAFGAPTDFTEKIEQQGCHIIDTTCGDVMKVWRRVRTYAKTGVTSLIHGKRGHEETRATASRAIGEDKKGHYLIVLTLAETEIVTDYIKNGGDKAEFLAHFEKAHSDGFDPDVHLKEVGVANQTTMLKSETEEIQRRVRTAISERDGGAIDNFQVFDTICGATQERQDALFDMLKKPMNALLVIGGYNSSNTAHLVEIGNENLPTYFIREASCLESLEKIVHFDLEEDEEITSKNVLAGFDDSEATIGITAGASCPANLIEETIVRVLNLRGIERKTVEAL